MLTVFFMKLQIFFFIKWEKAVETFVCAIHEFWHLCLQSTESRYFCLQSTESRLCVCYPQSTDISFWIP